MNTKTFYENQQTILIHGDVLEIARGWRQYQKARGTFNLVIADYPFKRNPELARITAMIAYDLLEDGGNFLVINNPHNLFETMQYYGMFRLRNGIPLIKKWTFAPAYHLELGHNYALLLVKGGNMRHRWNGSRVNHEKSRPDYIMDWNAGYTANGDFHPEAIPYKYAEYFIDLLSDEGDNVFDMFGGSGNFAVAAQDSGRSYVGVELKLKYCKIIRKRCSQIRMIGGHNMNASNYPPGVSGCEPEIAGYSEPAIFHCPSCPVYQACGQQDPDGICECPFLDEPKDV